MFGVHWKLVLFGVYTENRAGMVARVLVCVVLAKLGIERVGLRRPAHNLAMECLVIPGSQRVSENTN